MNLYNTKSSHENYENSLYFFSNQNTIKEEQILFDNFPFYVRDKRFSTLSVALIYRIVSKYYANPHENDESEIQFLFDCLDYHKRSASVLFSVIQIDENHKYVIDKLLNDYSDVFDFNYINQSLLHKVNDIKSEMIKMHLKFEKQAQEMEQMKTDFGNIFQQQVQEMEQMKTGFKAVIEQQNEKSEALTESFNEAISKLETQISNSWSHFEHKFLIQNSPRIYKFDSIGIHLFQAPFDGDYKLEVWGAQGGSTYFRSKSVQGGKGGYSIGIIHLKKGTTLYINVGGQGGKSITTCQSGAGYNGGGAGYYHDSNGNENTAYVGGGGGSTDIRIIDNSLHSRVIVAGGGGAAGYDQQENPGGLGGGTCGESKQTHKDLDRRSNGGTQIAGGHSTSQTEAESGSFGQGGNGIDTWVAGGGGGWYGGSACYCGDAAGGSGWIYTESTFKTWKEGNQTDSLKWLLNPEYYLSDGITISGNKEIPSHDGKSQTIGNSGNGYAQITIIRDE